MAGCTGINPEPLACCPQSAYGQTTSPDVDVNATCANGYEPGSFWIREDTTPYEVWIMNACPQDWVCISGCDTNLYHFKAQVDTGLPAQTFLTGTPTDVEFQTEVYNTPSASWMADTTYEIPENGVYQFSCNFVLDYRTISIASVNDTILELRKNGAVIVSRLDAIPIHPSPITNEFIYLGGSQSAPFTAGDTVKIVVTQFSGSTVPGAAASTFAPIAGVFTIDQLA